MIRVGPLQGVQGGPTQAVLATPPQAWDDDQIDLADAQPEHRWKPTGSTQKRAVDLVEDAEFVRSNDGYLQASVPEVAARLGVSPDRLSQAYSRALPHWLRVPGFWTRLWPGWSAAGLGQVVGLAHEAAGRPDDAIAD